MVYPSPHDLLAQRFPFLFLRQVLRHVDNGIVAAVGAPRLPGVEKNASHVPLCIAVEMMAQASAALHRLEMVGGSGLPPQPGTMAMITNARLYSCLFDQDDLVAESRRIQRIGQFSRFAAHLSKQGKKVAEAELTLLSAAVASSPHDRPS